MNLDWLRVSAKFTSSCLIDFAAHGDNVDRYIDGLSFAVLFMLDYGADEVGYFVNLATEGRRERLRL